jgi:UDP-N-acetylmuramate--alanine ligase
MTVVPSARRTEEHVLPLPLARRAPEPPQRAHLVGVCGSGMQGLARLLHGWGWTLSGSDSQPANGAIHDLVERGLTFHHGHAAVHLPNDAQWLIYSPAIPADNPERIAATERGVPQVSYTQMLGRLLRERQGVCIAGTHGKSTTTAMTASILRDAGWQASAIFGAELSDRGGSSWAGTGDLFVVESCEFQRGFWDFAPQSAAILSVEPDHFDCFATREALIEAFGGFAARVSPNGLLLVRSEDAAALKASRQSRAEVLTFGWTEDADWWAGDVRRTALGTRCRLFRRGQYITELQVPVPGRHNVLNALAASALSYELGVPASDIRAGLQDFAGIRRRFELVGSWRGVTLVDDYAHHPTAVETTLQTARELFGQRRIWCAFQPHQVSRTQALLTEFSRSFRLADHVLVAPVFAARERVTTEPRELSQRLAREIETYGPRAEFSPSLDQLVQVLEDALQPGDVLLTLGAGDIDQVHHAFTRRVFRDSAARRAARTVHLDEGGWSGTVLPHSA